MLAIGLPSLARWRFGRRLTSSGLWLVSEIDTALTFTVAREELVFDVSIVPDELTG
jgi:Tfp pilus assembly protein FimT